MQVRKIDKVRRHEIDKVDCDAEEIDGVRSSCAYFIAFCRCSHLMASSAEQLYTGEATVGTAFGIIGAYMVHMASMQ